eukprot:11222131-Lingulodinium_polyedra.AAC.1
MLRVTEQHANSFRIACQSPESIITNIRQPSKSRQTAMNQQAKPPSSTQNDIRAAKTTQQHSNSYRTATDCTPRP